MVVDIAAKRDVVVGVDRCSASYCCQFHLPSITVVSYLYWLQLPVHAKVVDQEGYVEH